MEDKLSNGKLKHLYQQYFNGGINGVLSRRKIVLKPFKMISPPIYGLLIFVFLIFFCDSGKPHVGQNTNCDCLFLQMPSFADLKLLFPENSKCFPGRRVEFYFR